MYEMYTLGIGFCFIRTTPVSLEPADLENKKYSCGDLVSNCEGLKKPLKSGFLLTLVSSVVYNYK